jgi:hypothetical protein
VPPDVPATAEITAIHGVNAYNFEATNSGDPGTSWSIIETPGTKPSGAAFNGSGVLSFTVT